MTVFFVQPIELEAKIIVNFLISLIKSITAKILLVLVNSFVLELFPTLLAADT